MSFQSAKLEMEGKQHERNSDNVFSIGQTL